MKRALAIPLLAIFIAIPAYAEAGRFIPGNVTRLGVRNSGMGGNHVALHGELSSALVNPAAILLDENSILFAFEGTVNAGPDFETRNGLNSVRSGEESPPLLLGFSTTFGDDYGFAIFDALRYNDHFTGSLFSTDDSTAQILSYEEEIRLSSTGVALAVRLSRRVTVGLGLYLDRQKVFKAVDYQLGGTAQIDPRDYEAFGTSKAMRGAIGILWTPRGRNTLGATFTTQSDLTNNLEQHTFGADSANPFFFEQSFPVSDDFFPWIASVGMHRRQTANLDLFGDVAYYNWGVDDNHSGMVYLSAGGEWRAKKSLALRAGFYTQTDPGDYSPLPGETEEDLRIRDLRTSTLSSYSVENTEMFLTGGLGARFGYFTLDVSVEDSHLFGDYGRTLVKLGLTGRLPNR